MKRGRLFETELGRGRGEMGGQGDRQVDSKL